MKTDAKKKLLLAMGGGVCAAKDAASKGPKEEEGPCVQEEAFILT